MSLVFWVRDADPESEVKVDGETADDLLSLLRLRRPGTGRPRSIRAVELWKRIDGVIRRCGWTLARATLASHLFWLQVLAHRGKRRRPPLVYYRQGTP